MKVTEVVHLYCIFCGKKISHGKLIEHIEKEHPHIAIKHSLGKFHDKAT